MPVWPINPTIQHSAGKEALAGSSARFGAELISSSTADVVDTLEPKPGWPDSPHAGPTPIGPGRRPQRAHDQQGKMLFTPT